MINIIGKDDKKCSMKQIFLIGNQCISDNNTMANSFNNYFINIGSSLAQKNQSVIDPLVFLQINVKL